MIVQRDRWGIVESHATRPQALMKFDFSERQARFLVTILECSGVFVERQYCAFAGIVHGQKTHDFIERLLRRRFAREIRPGALHRGRLYHVHHKALYAAIGEPDNRHRRRAPVARLVERLMVLDAVLDDANWIWLTTERDKLRYCEQPLANYRLGREALPHLAFGSAPTRTLRFFPEKLPIGIERSATDHVLLYLLTKPTTADFRTFLIRHFNLLTLMHRWTIRVLVPRPLVKAIRLHERAFREECTRPISMSESHELMWYFQQRRAAEHTATTPVAPRFLDAEKQFGGARFRLLYHLWRQCGNDVIWNLGAHHILDKLERGEGRLEFVALNRQYLHLSHLVGVA